MTDAPEIRRLNDAFRRSSLSGGGGQWVITPGISEMPYPAQASILAKVVAFERFCEDNDPHGEHDFGSFEHLGQRISWKIDYYDLSMEYGSEDPADPTKTRRVLTIMLASEY